MEKSDPLKTARQLDFTAICRASAASSILPEHPQSKLQSKLLALALKKQAESRPETLPEIRPEPEVKPKETPKVKPAKKVVEVVDVVQKKNSRPFVKTESSKSRQQSNVDLKNTESPKLQKQNVELRKSESPKRRQQDIMEFKKIESPKLRQQSNVELKDGTLKKKQCNCKNSRCLKLYCECFSAGIYCNGCNCTNCHNNVENEAARQEAIGAVLERNPNAFRPKIANSPHRSQDNKIQIEAGESTALGKHNKGCNCKKSWCLKKYCECFQANIACSENCRCIDCKNCEGGEVRSLSQGEQTNVMAFMQHGDVQSFGYISQASRKRKVQSLFGGEEAPGILGTRSAKKHVQETYLTSLSNSSDMPSVPFHGVATETTLGSSDSIYRSRLAAIRGLMDVKELCSLLVVVSTEGLSKLADEHHIRNEEAEVVQNEAPVASSNQLSTDKIELDGQVSTGNQGDKVQLGASESNPVAVQHDRAMSPGTCELMCHEQDTTFLGAQSPSGVADCNEQSKMDLSFKQGSSDLYAEQERLVLTNFLNCLNRIVTSGSKQGVVPSSSAQTAAQREPLQNGIKDFKLQRSHNHLH